MGKKIKTSLPPMVSYPGGKSRVSKKILKEFPKEYDTYVEPFVGGGSIYWREEKAKKRVINDMHKPLIKQYKKFRKVNCKKLQKCNANVSKSKFKNICKKKQKSSCEWVTSHAKSYAGFCENGYSHKKSKLSNIKNRCEDYKQKLKKTTILNQDWKKVVKKHCKTKKDVCYLDPPYVKKSFNYRKEGVTAKQICSFAKKTKSKVIISYDDHPDVRKECKGLNIKKIDFCYGMTAGPLGKCKPVKELLIKNF